MQYTPTQRRLLDMLSDGKPHRREELYGCIDDELADVAKCLRVHLTHLRKKLRKLSQDVLCELHRGKPHYRHVMLLRWDGD